MRQGWARSLTAVGGARPPALNAPLRVVTQGRVDSDGVSEAGVPAGAVRALFAGTFPVEDVAQGVAGAAVVAVLGLVVGVRAMRRSS